MTEKCFETGLDLLNPYILVYGPQEIKAVPINVSTLGFDGQRERIDLSDEATIDRLRHNGNPLYKIMSAIGRYEHPLRWDMRHAWARGIRSKDKHEVDHLDALGLLEASIVERILPKCYEALRDY